MTMQARMTANDQRLYNPSRDVAHNFQQVMEMVAGRLEDYSWTELAEVLKREGITMDDLGEACGAYCDYLATSAKMPHWSMYDSLEHCGFFKTKPAAQVAVLAMIGTCYAGIQYAGIREATVGGEGPLATIEELMVHAQRFREYTGMSRRRRRWERFKLKFQTAISAFKRYGKGE
jgi:hypothetical protein